MDAGSCGPGDEDWVVHVTSESVAKFFEFGTPFWATVMDSLREPTRIDLPDGGVLLVGCH